MNFGGIEVDIAVSALTAWRENRSHGRSGLQSVLNVLSNRKEKHNSSLYQECIRPLQFSSVTAKGDPELTLYPLPGDTQMALAVDLARQAYAGDLTDITNGSTLYYQPDSIVTHLEKTFTKPDGTIVAFPDGWSIAAVKFMVEIGNQLFFVEV